MKYNGLLAFAALVGSICPVSAASASPVPAADSTVVTTSAAAPAAKEKKFTVEIHGTVRAKFEYEPEINESRFQVRNARFSLSGNVTPVVAYKAEIDLSDEGTIKMLDAYVRLNMLRDALRFSVGQMRVPFTIDAHRSPHEQFFANRSFIAKQVGNVRDVGAALGYSFGETVPIVIEGGIFNGSGLTNQKDYWTNNYNFSAKVHARFVERVNVVLSVQKTRPDIVPIMMYNAGAYYDYGRLHAEAEYLRKHYGDDAFDAVDAFNSFVCYDVPVKRLLNKISFLARYDYMSDHSRGIAGPNGVLGLDDPERHRVTGGLTFSLGLPFRADVRLNYESYFYSDDVTPAISEQDKIVIEFMARF